MNQEGDRSTTTVESPNSVANSGRRSTARSKRADLQCQSCYKCFSKPEHLVRHERVHSGSKPFVCPYTDCGKRFNRQDSLVRHGRTHDTTQTTIACPQSRAVTPLNTGAAFDDISPTFMTNAQDAGPNLGDAGTDHQLFFTTPNLGDSSTGDTWMNNEQSHFWPESEDLFAMLTSEPSAWRLDAQLPFLNGPPTGGEEPQSSEPDGPSARARHALQHTSSLIQDLSFSVSREVESIGVTADFLDTCLSCFFSRFVPVLPVMHQPTFVLKDCTPPLLLNMIALGSLFVASEGATARGEALWRLAHTAVATSWQSMIQRTGNETSQDAAMGMQLVMTALLGQSYAVLSGSRSLRLTSHAFHGLGFYWSRQAGLAAIHSSSGSYYASANPEVDVARWKEWAASEVNNRAILGHYILDGLISHSSGFPNSTRHTTNNMRLPCSDEAFDAQTADVWLAVMSRERATAEFTFRELLNKLFDVQTPFVDTLLSHMSIPVVMEALQSLVSESHESDGPSVGLPSQAALNQALWRLYDYQVMHQDRARVDVLDLSIRWHVVCISFCVQPSSLVYDLCERYGVRQELYKLGRSAFLKAFDLDAWSSSHLARRATLHAMAVLDLLQQLPLGKTQALQLPIAVFTSAVVLTAVNVTNRGRIQLPEPICWQTVCTMNDTTTLDTPTIGGDAASTASFLLTGNVVTGARAAIRNIGRDVNAFQTILESSMSTWGVTREMTRILRQLVPRCMQRT